MTAEINKHTQESQTAAKHPPQLPGKTTYEDREFITNLYDDDTSPRMEEIKESLQTVFDPEFPLIDIYTLGLVYVIDVNEDDEHIDIIMTYTTPACPAGEMIQEMMRNALASILPSYTVSIEVTFDPHWDLKFIKDQDLRRMFE